MSKTTLALILVAITALTTGCNGSQSSSVSSTVNEPSADTGSQSGGNSTTNNSGGSSGNNGANNSGGDSTSSVLQLVSNRSDLISGDDALIEIILPEGTDFSDVQIDANGHDISSAFALRENGRYMGLVSGLTLGQNLITADLGHGNRSSLTLINHPHGGPVTSGPQLLPWRCQEGAQDAQCNQPPVFSYLYKSTDPSKSGLLPYDPANPATDVATTTTDQGVTLPFIVRVETGYQDRDQYKILTLFQPGTPWEPWAPQEQWNHKVFIPHGGNCGASYKTGNAPLEDYSGTVPTNPQEHSYVVALSRGFAVMSTALDNSGHNCNIALQAESLIMAKEYLVERYGEIRYTIGSGCSGGSIVQHSVANAYPGIYQGLIVTCSFPDTLSVGVQFFDYHQLRVYFEDPSKWGEGVIWSPEQWALVEGHAAHVNAIAADELLFKAAIDPTHDCSGTSDENRYHPENNPGGVRCSVFDHMINVVGPRPESVWSPNEQALGHGFAGIPVGNVGIQYGLHPLQTGQITPAMFVDLNAKIGGLNVDFQPTVERLQPNQPALANVYRSGSVNDTDQLRNVAIIDHRGPDPGVAHDARWSWVTRARLQRAQGHFQNQVIWYGEEPLIGDLNYATEALIAMDRWLALVEADPRDVPIADKIVQDRPGDLHDRCTQGQAISSPDGLNISIVSPTLSQILGPELIQQLNDGLYPALDPAMSIVIDPVLDVACGPGIAGDAAKTKFASPREVAGDVFTADNFQCQLKPLNRNDDYGPIAFTDAEWEMMQQTFPDGVCDYSRPGQSKQATLTWLKYEDEEGKIVYGGQPLPATPFGVASGWVSPAFFSAP